MEEKRKVSKSSESENLLHKTVQTFLTHFKKGTRNEQMNFSFKSNPDVYVVEPQVPDLWLKTRKPFDRNLCFVFGNESVAKLFSRENLFPKVPYVIPDESNLNAKHLHVNKIKVEDLFGGVKIKIVDVFAEDFDFSNLGSDEAGVKRKRAKTFEENKQEVKNGVIKNKKEISEPASEEKDTISNLDKFDILNQKRNWYMVLPNQLYFGPYNCHELNLFLTNLFTESPNLKNEHTFMICDSEADIFYQPEAAMEILAMEIKENPQKKVEVNDFKKKFDYLNETPTERTLGNPHLITKYDVCEMNSKFKKVQCLPVKQLKEQLKCLKFKDNIRNHPNPNPNHNPNPNFNAGRKSINVGNKTEINQRTIFTSKSPRGSISNKFNLGLLYENKNNTQNAQSNNTNHLSQKEKENNMYNTNTTPIKNVSESLKNKESGSIIGLNIPPNAKLISIKDTLFN